MRDKAGGGVRAGGVSPGAGPAGAALRARRRGGPPALRESRAAYSWCVGGEGGGEWKYEAGGRGVTFLALHCLPRVMQNAPYPAQHAPSPPLHLPLHSMLHPCLPPPPRPGISPRTSPRTACYLPPDLPSSPSAQNSMSPAPCRHMEGDPADMVHVLHTGRREERT